jgi:transposase
LIAPLEGIHLARPLARASHWLVQGVASIADPVCPGCGVDRSVRPARILLHGQVPIRLADLPHKGLPVRIQLCRQRYHCTNCGKTWITPTPGLEDGLRITRRLAEYVRRQIRTRTYSEVAVECGIDPKTVRKLSGD